MYQSRCADNLYIKLNHHALFLQLFLIHLAKGMSGHLVCGFMAILYMYNTGTKNVNISSTKMFPPKTVVKRLKSNKCKVLQVVLYEDFIYKTRTIPF